MKVLNVMMTDTDSGDIVKCNQIDIVNDAQLSVKSKVWFDCFLRGVLTPIGAGHWQLTLTVAEITPKLPQHKQLNIF